MFSLGRRHRVTPLDLHQSQLRGFVNAQSTGNIVRQFEEEVSSKRLAKLNAKETLDRLLEFLDQHSIDLMLIKGAAYDALVYQRFERVAAISI